ncbi:hypothetical protein SPISAL_01835 [Spiribacter salinus M19-40]|uniref:Serine/threonine protein kinase n=1 Tax=Spiribacter salinus M19-40 TaxID=1260251 RepID=R4VDR4_9GAMM|nr:hypothetical protein [Spiribacter salinus]AGM40466.1 hypothetical protein SPISAL_01835 [Spiribacter salinus M19-40]MDR9413340.1 hypothetical protein [Spiribacter sp.]MDR9454405.1 hypothetical protein [Spiribacter sp.]
MARENDRIDRRIACLRTEHMPATLVSDDGYHCAVWRSGGTLWHEGRAQTMDMVIKVPRQAVNAAEVRVLKREHETLRAALGDIVPQTVFARTLIDGQVSVVAMAPNIRRWFDMANPIHGEQIAPLLAQSPRLREALASFVCQAEAWYQNDRRVIDLYGRDNLIFDRNRHLHYIDSFGVFFHEDLLHVLPDPDAGLAERIRISRLRLNYLSALLEDGHAIHS